MRTERFWESAWNARLLLIPCWIALDFDWRLCSEAVIPALQKELRQSQDAAGDSHNTLVESGGFGVSLAVAAIAYGSFSAVKGGKIIICLGLD